MRLIVTLCILLVLLGCANDKQAEKVIFDAEQLLDTNPDSAIILLNKEKDKEGDWSKSQRMHYELVYAQAQNKAFVPFTTDSIVLELADYYSHHGSANEKMIANYMVGCAYRDLGDAPSALKYMNIAVDAADKNNKNCDLRTLMGIHGQMITLYQTTQAFENLYTETIQAEQIAWLLNDTVSALNMKWFRACNYYDSNHHQQALAIIDSIENFNCIHNLQENPVLTYPIRISIQLHNRNTLIAGQLLNEYEQKLGITPMSPTNEIIDWGYITQKGKYYIETEQADSAIIIFKRMLEVVTTEPQFIDDHNGFKEESYHGLMEAYSLKQLSDSAIKYAQLYCMLNDSTTREHSSTQLLNIKSLYNYSRIQEQALKSANRVSQLRISFIIFTFLIIIFLGTVWGFYQKYKRINRSKQIEANRNYQQLLSQLTKATEELNLVKKDSERFSKEKENEIQQLQSALAIFQANNLEIEQWTSERDILDCDVVTYLHELSSTGKRATQDEFNRLAIIAKNGFPNFYSSITNKKHMLSDSEILVCILIRLRFIPSEIVLLTTFSSQRVTNIKASINKKMFGKTGAKSLEAHLLALK